MASMDEIMNALAPLELPPLARPDPLKWFDDEDGLPAGWVLEIGYTVECEQPGDEPGIWIHRARLNTGQRQIEMSLHEIDTGKYEALILGEELAQWDCS